MKNTKTRFQYFSILQWKEEQEYLREQHKQGWKLVRVDLIGRYLFEKCEPEDVVYQLDYNPEGDGHKAAYVQMFEDCGWEYLQDYVGYSYFRKPVSQMKEEEEIFCDDASRADMMKRVFKGKMIPLACILLLVILPNIYMQSRINTVSSHILLGVLIALLAIYAVLFASFGIRLWKYMKSLHQ